MSLNHFGCPYDLSLCWIRAACTAVKVCSTGTENSREWGLWRWLCQTDSPDLVTMREGRQSQITWGGSSEHTWSPCEVWPCTERMFAADLVNERGERGKKWPAAWCSGWYGTDPGSSASHLVDPVLPFPSQTHHFPRAGTSAAARNPFSYGQPEWARFMFQEGIHVQLLFLWSDHSD